MTTQRMFMLCTVMVGCATVAALWHGDERARPASTAVTTPAKDQAQQVQPVVARRLVELPDLPASADTRRLTQWVVDSADNGSAPFVIIDKRNARVLAFTPQGKLIDSAPALLGYAEGDHSVPGIGDKPIADIRPEERTTPAGRFVSEPGRNHQGEAVVWVDYEAAVSMHRLRRSKPAERRAERMASYTPEDNRISYGCINVPVDFFERVIWPTWGDTNGVIYVMPDHLPLEQVFPGLANAPGLQAAAESVPGPGS